MANINIRESLGRRDLSSNNKYDLRNTYDSLNLSESKKKQLAKALYENKSNRAIYSILNTDESFSKHSRRHRLMLESEGKYFGLMYYEPGSGESGMEADKFYLSDCGEFNSIEEARAFWRKYLLRDKGRAFVSEITKAEYEDWLAESELEKEWEASYNQTYGTNLYDESLNRHQLLENAYIKQFSRYSREYEKLDRLATFLTAMSPNKFYYYVGDTYFDFGQDWMWTTVIAQKGPGYDNRGYQALSPRAQEAAILAQSDEELERLARQILASDFCPDKKSVNQESFSTKADLFKSMNRSHELDEAAFSGGMAGDNSASGGTIRGRGASTQPDKKSYLGRLKNKNPDLVDIITVKGKDIKRGMITQSGQVKEAEVKRNNRGETKVYIMHTNNYDGFWDADEDMEVLADPENKSKPFTGDYRALLKMGLKESASLVNEKISAIKKEVLKEAFNADRVQKRIACTTEFDNGHVFHNDYFRASSAEAEEMARQKSIENPGKVFYVKYDNVMEPCSDIKWKNGQKIDESKSTDLEDAVFTKNRYDDKIYYHGFMDKKDADRHYPDRLRTRTYWYSTRHGVMPGSVPKGINILDVKDIGNKSYFKTDSIISSKDLKYYDIKEDIPPMEESKRSLKKHSRLLKEDAYIKTFKLGDPEFENLYKLADILTKKSPNKYIYYVGDTYFDLGQDWMWTTVLCRGDWSSYQALDPREQEEAILANSDAELEKIADSVLSDKYCPDKKRISEDAIADKIRANQDTKEMTKRAIQILKKKGAEYKDLEKEYEKIYGDKLIFDEK